ncbi:MAG: VCBS repeat-containing protein [Bacteroidetes bacterium]|nr:VCBS repeat-containing protein [Bacteroidota bacterium]
MFKQLKLSRNQLYFSVICLFVALTVCSIGCQQRNVNQDDLADGKALSQKYCISCHQWPDPALIDSASWVHGVLPAMALRLGVKSYMGQYFIDQGASLSISDWQKIINYYAKVSPKELVIPKPAVAPKSDWSIFSLLKPKEDIKSPIAMTTLLAYNPYDGHFYSGDAGNNFYRWDEQLRPTLVQKMTSPVTGAIFSKNGNQNEAVVTCIGFLPPRDVVKGQVIKLDLDSKAKNKDQLVVGDSLPRAVQTVAADFNKDGLTDYVVCGFGHEFGGLYLLQQQANHSFVKKAIRNVPGGEQLITGDFNNDGWPDVMCLFAQADEGIWMFLNDHKGGFIEKNLLHFPAIYGSSSFQLVDFNHDGLPDILYTCGDNSDYSRVLKPYHGVYIFTNQGGWKFKQTYFYHIDGCTKAIAADFDHDGDLDIATIAFFADFKNHPSQGFTYLEQTSPNNFIPHEIPVDHYGRWLTMETGDIDHDGNLDIILGNFSTTGRGLLNQKGFQPQWDQHLPVIVLRNTGSVKSTPIVSK